MEYPIRGIHCIGTGDTNRWEMEFASLGYKIEDREPFAKLFKQYDENAERQ